MSNVHLKSRLPEIALELRPRVEAALKAGGELIAEGAKGRVPVNTGRLKRAIHVEEHGLGVNVVAGDDQAWYGHLVEHGGANTPPRPFLVPAAEAALPEVEALIAKTLRSL